MLIKRDIEEELRGCANEYPIVTILGPRQSGKTTLARMVFPDKQYFSMEDPNLRNQAAEDPRGFLENMPDGAILDEIQRLPDILSYLQNFVDNDNRPGLFIITGSHQPELHQAVSQTLAGRTAILNLLPFSHAELCRLEKQWDPFELCCMGAYPRLHDKHLKAERFFAGYIQTYIERDVRALINLKDLDRFQVFLRLLAGRVGQLVNYSALSNDAGVSAGTIKNWISVLKASFVAFELPPYYENIRKRVTKSPKVFFCDVGLACYLLGIHNARQLQRDPLRGGLYENMIILEVLKERLNHGLMPQMNFYRDSHGREVDLIIREGRMLHPIEIKSASTFTPDFIIGIKSFHKVVENRCGRGMVCYNGKEKTTFKDTLIFNPFIHGGFDFAVR